VDFRAGSDVADFSLDEHGRIDGFEGFDGLPGLADIFFEGQGGKIKDDGIESGFGSLDAFRERMGVIGVEENGEVKFLAQAADESGDLTSAYKVALALGQTYEHGNVEFAGSGEYGFQENEVRNIEMADGLAGLLGLLQQIA